MTIRGKNRIFFENILAALQLDKLKGNVSLKQLKDAVSVDVVRKIHLLIPAFWPDLEDFKRSTGSMAGTTTAFYTGKYEPADVLRAVKRLSLYCDHILLIDPFVRTDYVLPKFNPLEYPEQHRATTIKFLNLWITLWPWIDAGIVSFVRPLHDFIPNLRSEVMEIQRARFDSHPELKQLSEEEANKRVSELNLFNGSVEAFQFLRLPESVFLEMFESFKANSPFGCKEEFLSYVQMLRDNHPYYVDLMPGQTSDFHIETSGACYELAKRMCDITDSHIVTNMRVRWREVELDRKNAGIDQEEWSPFAKAFQGAEFKALAEVPMEIALSLRKEQHLESMRMFLRRVWKTSRSTEVFAESNALDLAAQLKEEIAIANEEWHKIDSNLIKILGVTGSTLLSFVSAGFLPAAGGAGAAVIAGITGLVDAGIKRKVFKNKYPAGLFLGV